MNINNLNKIIARYLSGNLKLAAIEFDPLGTESGVTFVPNDDLAYALRPAKESIRIASATGENKVTFKIGNGIAMVRQEIEESVLLELVSDEFILNQACMVMLNNASRELIAATGIPPQEQHRYFIQTHSYDDPEDILLYDTYKLAYEIRFVLRCKEE